MIHQLTGLRFIAAAVVLLVHAGDVANHGSQGIGFLATNAATFFFVLSGFILTHVYADRLQGGGKIVQFYVARFARIWPTHLACLAIMTALLIVGQDLNWNRIALQNFTANVLMVHSWVPNLGTAFWFNGPSWSVSTEFGFYILFPILLPLLLRWPKTTLAVVCVACLGGVVGVEYAKAQDRIGGEMATYLVYVNPLIRFCDFTVGAFIGKRFHEHATQWGTAKSIGWEWTAVLACAGVFSVVSYYGFNSLLPGNWRSVAIQQWVRNGALMVPFYGLLIYVFACSTGPFSRLLSHPTSVFLGEISFAFYLVQQPLIYAWEYLTEGVVLSSTFTFVSLTLLALAGAIVLHYFVEMPLRNGIVNLSRWKSPRKTSTISHYGTALGQPLVWLSILLFAVMGPALHHEVQLRRGSTERQRLAILWGIQDQPQKSVPFADQATLLSLTVQRVTDDVVVRMLWEKGAGWDRKRFLHILDKDGNILQQGEPSFEIFHEAEIGGYVLDECLIPIEKLNGAAQIGIGFFSPEQGAVPIQSTGLELGLGMNGKRLNIVDVRHDPRLVR